jgi:Cu(I)/Ag(I) efflux system periplasmic protein CusF
MKLRLAIPLAAVLMAAPIFVFAQNISRTNDHASHRMAAVATAADMQMVDGLVKKVDKSAGKVTLSHGPLTNLGMPAMTMVFRVQDARWLDQMKERDKIRFMADKVNGAFAVVHFELAN